jgi:DNA-binding XRE family transcriptional regulator
VFIVSQEYVWAQERVLKGAVLRRRRFDFVPVREHLSSMANAQLTPAQKTERRRRAEQFRAFRREHLLSQTDLADQMGTGRRTIAAIELCEVEPAIRTLRKFNMLRTKLERKAAVAA